jgi:hypothetical protein
MRHHSVSYWQRQVVVLRDDDSIWASEAKAEREWAAQRPEARPRWKAKGWLRWTHSV